ncbi:hypothetical protein [Sinomonas flava]
MAATTVTTAQELADALSGSALAIEVRLQPLRRLAARGPLRVD